MNSIEQAREAREYVARYGGRCRDCADHDGICPTSGLPCNVEDCNKAIDHVIKALNYGLQHGFLSPSALVDGVGAEPVGWQRRLLPHPKVINTGWFPITNEQAEFSLKHGHLDGEPSIKCEVRPVYAAPLASPEAEARLRERVAEGERLRFEGDLDRWMKIIGAGITGYQPEAYAVMDAACRELVSLRAEDAEARLAQAERNGPCTLGMGCDDYGFCYADHNGRPDMCGRGQAEGGPAVTEAMTQVALDTWFQTPRSNWFPEQHQKMRAAFEAALHPQSAAGEEGK